MQVLSRSFDFAPYRRIPHLTARTAVGLGQALCEARPRDRSTQVDQAVQNIAEAIEAVCEVLEDGPQVTSTRAYGDGAGFEGGTEALWEVLRGRLSTWQGFEHPGLDPLIARGDGLGNILDGGRAKAERARICAELLFSGAGLRLFRGRYDDQATSMGVLLRLIDDGELDADIEELVGAEILPALIGCKARYSDMIAERSRGASAESELGQRCQGLQRSIELYCVAVLALLTADTQEAADTVSAALRPIIVLRTQMSEGRWMPGEEEPALVDDLDEEAGLESVFEDGSVAVAI